MQLILVRHGRAEDRSPDREDFIRELTSDGEKKFKKAARGLAKLLKDQKKILVVSSPLKRSMQTAAIVLKAIKADEEVWNCAATGDFEELKKKLSDNKKYGAIMVIGHEPILGEWTQKLTGMHLVFSKGGGAGFLLSEDCSKAEMLWFMHPKYLMKK